MTNSGTDCRTHHNCNVSKALKIIGGKWTLMIIHNLFDGPKRFGQLQRILTDISPKTLSSRLQELKQAGVVKRTVYPQIPLKVEYRLTKKGLSLGDIFKMLAKWGNQA